MHNYQSNGLIKDSQSQNKKNGDRESIVHNKSKQNHPNPDNLNDKGAFKEDHFTSGLHY